MNVLFMPFCPSKRTIAYAAPAAIPPQSPANEPLKSDRSSVGLTIRRDPANAVSTASPCTGLSFSFSRSQENTIVKNGDILLSIDASESTVRRDLLELDRLGKLNRVHGGATLTDRQFVLNEADIEEKIRKNVNEKKAIAEFAAMQIQDGDFVYLDAGTTTLLMIDFITARDAQFVTNGIVHARNLAARGLRTHVLGGELKSSTEAVVGAEAVQALQNYNFSKAFLGTNGIHPKFGYTTPDSDEALLKTAAMERSFVKYIVSDYSKFGKVTTVTFAQLDEAAIITDQVPPQLYLDSTVVKAVGNKTLGPGIPLEEDSQ